MSCFICRDSPQEVYKICECVDSILCNECLVMTNTNNIIKCPICRKILKTTKTRNYYETLKLSLQYFGLKFLLYMTPLLFPIISYINNYIYKELSFYLTLYSVLIFEPLIIKNFTEKLKFKELQYIIVKVLFICIIIPLIFTLKKNIRNSFFILCFLFPLYGVPLLIISFEIEISKFKEWKIKLDNKTITKFLKFKKITNNINEI
jgi:hypothetical protein|uniref:RING-type domain-containing protein n=1 Tax=Mimiviridae sp. ChoanoV1 TaxID=2596887 RepID=A0A5B8IGB8_9VIRU|nr:hypothetical protein 4_17 [Mimiviridae sp. ChoanoV1]